MNQRFRVLDYGISRYLLYIVTGGYGHKYAGEKWILKIGGDRNAQSIPLFALVTILLSRGCRDPGAARGAEGVTGSGPREESGSRLRGGEAPADQAHSGQPQS